MRKKGEERKRKGLPEKELSRPQRGSGKRELIPWGRQSVEGEKKNPLQPRRELRPNPKRSSSAVKPHRGVDTSGRKELMDQKKMIQPIYHTIRKRGSVKRHIDRLRKKPTTEREFSPRSGGGGTPYVKGGRTRDGDLERGHSNRGRKSVLGKKRTHSLTNREKKGETFGWLRSKNDTGEVTKGGRGKTKRGKGNPKSREVTINQREKKKHTETKR